MVLSGQLCLAKCYGKQKEFLIILYILVPPCLQMHEHGWAKAAPVDSTLKNFGPPKPDAPLPVKTILVAP